MMASAGFSPLARLLILSAAVAILVLFLRLAAPILAPILLAVFVTIVSLPVLRGLRRIGLPKWGALAAVAFFLVDIGSFPALADIPLAQQDC